MNLRIRPLLHCLMMALLIGLLANSLAQAREIYRWVDEKGVAHYGDQPSPNAERMRVRDGKAVGPSAEEKAESEEMKKLRADQCQLAKARYGEYNSSDRLIEKDDFGKQRELSPEERLAAIAKAKSDVDAYCQ